MRFYLFFFTFFYLICLGGFSKVQARSFDSLHALGLRVNFETKKKTVKLFVYLNKNVVFFEVKSDTLINKKCFQKTVRREYEIDDDRIQFLASTISNFIFADSSFSNKQLCSNLRFDFSGFHLSLSFENNSKFKKVSKSRRKFVIEDKLLLLIENNLRLFAFIDEYVSYDAKK